MKYYILVKIFQMFQIFQNPYPSVQVFYDPYRYSNQPGMPCPICKENVVHHSAISICQCRIFTHRKCFLNWFPKHPSDENKKVHTLQIAQINGSENKKSSKMLPLTKNTSIIDNQVIQNNRTFQFDPQQDKLICRICKSHVKMQFDSQNVFAPHMYPLKNFVTLIILLILQIIFLIALIVFILKDQKFSPFPIVTISYAALLNFLLIVIVLITVLFKKVFHLKGVYNTERSLYISAFGGINEIQQANTHQQLFIEKKQDHYI